MGIREDICEIKACQAELKEGQQKILEALAALDFATIAEICEKLDEHKKCLDELKDELLGNCPMLLVEPMTNSTAVVAGDQTADNPPGSQFDVTDDNGNLVGTATVTSATYNAATDQTTFTLSNNTVPAATLVSVKSVTKKRVAAEEEKKEAAVER